MNIQDWKDITGLVLQVINLLIIAYGGYRFLNRPHDTLEKKHDDLEKRVDGHDLEIKDIRKSLDASHEKHRDQERTNKVFKKVFILLANFEVTYCQEMGFEHTDDLVEAKKELEKYLAGE